MLRDPFYRQIEQALEGPLDPQVFERCMGDLLRTVYPWIVPVSGGTDSGMDGAIADGEGEPFPLVCTTAADVIGNLTRSLDSYLKGGLPRRKVVLATSRKLTTRKRDNLFKCAREKRFQLLQVFDREAVADRLIGSPRWCKELLGLAWKASALSTVPPTHRPLIEIEPVGRDRDLAWLEETTGDRVLTGEPGSGKTFLFYHLMRRRSWPALFLSATDLGEFAEAWREQRPQVVVVDDAHVEPELLQRLARVRQEMGASFEIVATTWKTGREAVMEALKVPAARVHKLELLTRDEILEVIRRVGVEAPNEVLRDLVSQAANKPGLAVTIASLWLQGSYDEVLEGTALTRTLALFFRRFLGSESTDVLACLAMGGDRGMSLQAVGGLLQIPPSRLWQIASGLSAGGVLSQVAPGILAVWPRKLRFALLRSAFFSGALPLLPYHSVLDLALDRESAIETIVAAKLHRAEIPNQELRELVSQTGSRGAWAGLAAVSKEEALWVLEHYPGDVVEIAGVALGHASEETILRLLQRAEEASDPPHSQPRHPMRVLQAWVQQLKIPVEEMVPRRRLLAKVAKNYLQVGGQRSVGLHGICLALSPALEDCSFDPGAGWTLTIQPGLLPLEQLRQAESIWADVKEAFSGIEVEDWQYLSSALRSWIHPSYATRGEKVPEEFEQVMRSVAANILRDVALSIQGKPGLTVEVREVAQALGLDLDLAPDPVFELLFPSIDYFLDDLERREAEWQVALGKLVDEWVSRSPAELADLLAGYETEAQRIRRAWPPRGDLVVCRRIAAQAEAPEAWLDALLARGASSVLTGPFVERIVEVRRVGWEHQAERLLTLDRQHAWSAVEAVLRLPSPPADLLERALELLGELPQYLEGLCLLRQVHCENLRTLLHHPRWELALSAAVGEWNAGRQGDVRAEVASDWRGAILASRPDGSSGESLNPSLQHWLGVILAKNHDLAFDWLTARLRDPERPYFISGGDPFGLALSVLGKDQRLRMVEELEKERAPVGFVGLLVGKDSEVFAKVLSSEALRSHHLEPLEFLPDESWMDLALLVLGAGHELDEVVGASLSPKGQIRVMWGPEAENWQEHERAFSRFETDPRDRVREIARRGWQLAAEQRRAAAERERQFAIHGRYV